MTLFFYVSDVLYGLEYVGTVSRDRKPSSAEIATGLRDVKRKKSTSNIKKTFRRVKTAKESRSIAKSHRKTLRAPSRLFADTTNSGNETRNHNVRPIHILIWMIAPRMQTERCDSPIPCVFTNDHSLFKSSDAVIVDTRKIDRMKRKQRLPSVRPPHQHWIGYLRESPTNVNLKTKPYETWFNWTIAYTMNADVIIPYGMCLPTRDKVAKDPGSITDVIRHVYGKSADSTPWTDADYNYTPRDHAIGKTRLVSWVVSRCQSESRREVYVAELKRHIEVDIYGKCAGKSVDKTTDHEFWADLFETHKFYLAFENSLYPDYITEKVWVRLQSGIVPIVLGGADYNSHLPPHSYIDVKDYSSPKSLAQHLHRLDKNDTLYNEYFAWKQNYSCFVGVPATSPACEVCRMMNENRNKINIIPDINKFWDKDSCIPTKDYYRGIVDDISTKNVSKQTGPKWPSFS